jgi:putative transcription factor
MTLCDMCGAETKLVVALVEGTELNVCDNCSKFGKVLRMFKEPVSVESVGKRDLDVGGEEEEGEEIIEKIVEGYGKLIREGREKLNLNQEEFAKKINEKASLIHGIESEHHEPSMKVAEKIEKFLHVKLVIKEVLEKKKFISSNSKGVTIGDLIKFKN